MPQIERRHLISRARTESILTSTAQCGQYLTPFFYGAVEEQVYLLCLDAKCKALDCILVQSGDVNSAGISVRKVVKAALDANATSVVLAHNHPSGVALPSEEDKRVTQVIRDALDAVDVLLAGSHHRRGRRLRLAGRRRHFGVKTWIFSLFLTIGPPATSRRPLKN